MDRIIYDGLTGPMPQPCPGRTWFEAIVEGWPDQRAVREIEESLHALELARHARPPVLEVTFADPNSPVSKYRVDPAAKTVVFTLAGPRTYLQGQREES